MKTAAASSWVGVLRALGAALATLALFAGAGSAAAAPNHPYRVTVWALVVFGPDGRLADMEVAEESTYPKEFVDRIRDRLSQARIQPPLDDGQPATLKSGVRIELEITPGENGGSARMLGLQMSPLPTKTYFASYPKDIARVGGWTGEVHATCNVGTDGRCSAIHVKALPGIPESVRRFARASLQEWMFMPQEVNGVPVEGEFSLAVRLNTLDDAPEDFRVPKFIRILRGR